MAMDLHYYYGDCTTPEAQAQIQQNFIKLLNESQFQDACRDPSLKDKCIAENVKVTCSLVDFAVSRRKKRAIGRKGLNFKMQYHGDFFGTNIMTKYLRTYTKCAYNIKRKISSGF